MSDKQKALWRISGRKPDNITPDYTCDPFYIYWKYPKSQYEVDDGCHNVMCFAFEYLYKNSYFAISISWHPHDIKSNPRNYGTILDEYPALFHFNFDFIYDSDLSDWF